ncbi:hypothetical protein T09_7439 [Trichinella sp. T9]|nr:hypothetical protein T09_7439 [Trichinella sp. T9]
MWSKRHCNKLVVSATPPEITRTTSCALQIFEILPAAKAPTRVPYANLCKERRTFHPPSHLACASTVPVVFGETPLNVFCQKEMPFVDFLQPEKILCLVSFVYLSIGICSVIFDQLSKAKRDRFAKLKNLTFNSKQCKFGFSNLIILTINI